MKNYGTKFKYRSYQRYILLVVIVLSLFFGLTAFAGNFFVDLFSVADNDVDSAKEIKTSTGIKLAPAPPINAKISILNGNRITKTAEVTLELSADKAAKMMIANDSNFSGADWEDFVKTKKWKLIPGAGEKFVYVKYMSAVGDETPVFQSRIYLQPFAVSADGADVNRDGRIDEADFRFFFDNKQQRSAFIILDINEDRLVDDHDFSFIIQNYGQSISQK